MILNNCIPQTVGVRDIYIFAKNRNLEFTLLAVDQLFTIHRAKPTSGSLQEVEALAARVSHHHWQLISSSPYIRRSQHQDLSGSGGIGCEGIPSPLAVDQLFTITSGEANIRISTGSGGIGCEGIPSPLAVDQLFTIYQAKPTSGSLQEAEALAARVSHHHWQDLPLVEIHLKNIINIPNQREGLPFYPNSPQFLNYIPRGVFRILKKIHSTNRWG